MKIVKRKIIWLVLFCASAIVLALGADTVRSQDSSRCTGKGQVLVVGKGSGYEVHAAYDFEGGVVTTFKVYSDGNIYQQGRQKLR